MRRYKKTVVGCLACLLLTSAALRAADAEVTDLAFGEFFTRPVGPRGLQPSPKLLQLQGQRVRIVGYQVEQETEQETPRTFILAPLPLKLGDEDEALADDLPPAVVFVHTATDANWPPPYLPGLLRLSGRLEVGSFVEADGRVATVRLIIDSPLEESDRPCDTVNFRPKPCWLRSHSF